MSNVADDTSWFRDTPHYWAETWLPLAYAVACVGVVSESSEKASMLYNLPEASIYHHCTNIDVCPSMRTLSFPVRHICIRTRACLGLCSR